MKKSGNTPVNKQKISHIRKEASLFIKLTEANSKKRSVIKGKCQILKFKKPSKRK